MAAVTETIKRVQLMQHLRVGLSARHPPVELDNVAELAGKWTAARKLHSDVQIMLDFQEIEPGDWTLGHVDFEFFSLKDSLFRA